MKWDCYKFKEKLQYKQYFFRSNFIPIPLFYHSDSFAPVRLIISDCLFTYFHFFLCSSYRELLTLFLSICSLQMATAVWNYWKLQTLSLPFFFILLFWFVLLFLPFSAFKWASFIQRCYVMLHSAFTSPKNHHCRWIWFSFYFSPPLSRLLHGLHFFTHFHPY